MIGSPIPTAICLTIFGIVLTASIFLTRQKEREARVAFAISTILSVILTFVAVTLDYNLFAENPSFASTLAYSALLIEVMLLVFTFLSAGIGLVIIIFVD